MRVVIHYYLLTISYLFVLIYKGSEELSREDWVRGTGRETGGVFLYYQADWSSKRRIYLRVL